MLYGSAIYTPARLSLFSSPMHLFVQCWAGGKWRKPAPLLEVIFQHETLGGQVSSRAETTYVGVRRDYAMILKIDILCLEDIYRQQFMRFSRLIFGPQNTPQVIQNIVSFGPINPL
jgi:hypothetical protein